MLQQHWRFEEYEWGMVLDDVRLRPVLHVVVVVPAAGLSVLMNTRVGGDTTTGALCGTSSATACVVVVRTSALLSSPF